uniref:Acyl-CoA-binding domain-containing protein n=2 Tax=Kalanchoe fedtschenkoi TaxID=63787 RepID=A0A7N1A1X9_KALFE
MMGLKKRMKLGRLKVQLGDSAPRSPIRHPKRTSNDIPAATASQLDDTKCEQLPETVVTNDNSSGSLENWMTLSIAGDKPTPRFNHAAAVVGCKMVVVGGESGNGLLDDVQVLNFDRFAWTEASSKLYLSPNSLPLKIPACKGHCLVSWGKKVILIGGKTDPSSEKLSVWVFDTESECWSLMEVKGDIPVARSGHTVVRASSVLILFGGEDAKRRKLNDLHMFDLKSLTWLPLHCTGTGPSPRSNHVATLYNDKTLLIFGGAAKSKTLGDLYSLDFETMIWSRIKIKGFHPSPRACCCGVLCGNKWYIAGGGSKKKKHLETLIFDVLKVEWSVVVSAAPSSVTANKGFSLVNIQHKDNDYMVAFGGYKKEPSNQVEVLSVEKNDALMARPSILNKVLGRSLESFSSEVATQRSNSAFRHQHDAVAKHNIASAVEHHGSGRKSLSESAVIETKCASGNVSLRKQLNNEEEYITVIKVAKNPEEETPFRQLTDQRITGRTDRDQANISDCKMKVEEVPSVLEDGNLNSHYQARGSTQADTDNNSSPEADCKPETIPDSFNLQQFYEAKVSALLRKNGTLEGQLAAALAKQEATENNLSSLIKGRHEMEKRLDDAVKEVELLKEKLASVELAHEEANNLANIVHSDNVRLEHDVAFLKAVLDDTQKELHTTRGVLAGERGRAFQLQVEVFHLKQRIQSMENRAPTPRKPFNS